MARVLSFLIRYFSNYYTLHRSDLAARAAPLDPRLNLVYLQAVLKTFLKNNKGKYQNSTHLFFTRQENRCTRVVISVARIFIIYEAPYVKFRGYKHFSKRGEFKGLFRHYNLRHYIVKFQKSWHSKGESWYIKNMYAEI